MKSTLLLAITLASLITSIPSAIGADTGDTPSRKRPALTEEQKKLRKEMVEKYDTNKNGRLDKAERSRISKEDQEKMDQAGIGGGRKAAGKAEKDAR